MHLHSTCSMSHDHAHHWLVWHLVMCAGWFGCIYGLGCLSGRLGHTSRYCWLSCVVVPDGFTLTAGCASIVSGTSPPHTRHIAWHTPCISLSVWACGWWCRVLGCWSCRVLVVWVEHTTTPPSVCYSHHPSPQHYTYPVHPLLWCVWLVLFVWCDGGAVLCL